MPRPVACSDAAELMTWLARSVGRLPRSLGTIAGSKSARAVTGRVCPESEGTGRLGGEVRGRGEQDEVLQRAVGEQRGVHGAQRAALRLAEQADLGRARCGQHLLDRVGDVVEDQVIERHPRVLRAGDPEVEQVHVEALRDEVLHQAVARHQVKDVWLEHEAVHQQQRDTSPSRVCARCALVAVQACLVVGPDRLAGRDPVSTSISCSRTWVPVTYFHGSSRGRRS